MIGILIGIALGFLSLLPGIHPNLIFPLILSITFANKKLSIEIGFSLLISANFFEFVKSSLLYIPNEGEILSLRFVEKMALEGRIKEALILQFLGAIIGLLIAILLFPLFSVLIPLIYNDLKFFILPLLFFLPIYLATKEDNFKDALAIYFISGILGVLVSFSKIENPLLPLLTGLFGVSSLLRSFNSYVPRQQKLIVIEISKAELLKSAFFGVISTLAIAFLPAIGPSQASLIASSIFDLTGRNFIVALASINFADIIISYCSFLTIGKGRNGVIEMLSQIGISGFYPIMICLISAITTFSLLMLLLDFLIEKISFFNKKPFKVLIIVLSFIITLLFSSIPGILILLYSSFLGYFCEYKKVSKTNLLGSLIIPTIAYFLL